MAQPSKLTPEVQARICEALKKGNYRSTAAAAAGIHRNTLINWEKRGEEGEAPYVDFLTAMQQAEAEAEMDLVDLIRNAQPGVPTVRGADLWQAWAWVLERRYGGKWSGKVKAHIAEAVDDLTNKLKAKPALHAEVVSVLAGEEPSTSGADPAKH
jgi:hypothetical protein